MAARKRLKTFVHVHLKNDGGDVTETQIYGPDDNVPADVASQIGDHCWAESPTASDDDEDDGPPPRSGRGSGRDKWAAYAEANGVEIDAEADRDAIIIAVAAAGVPVE